MDLGHPASKLSQPAENCSAIPRARSTINNGPNSIPTPCSSLSYHSNHRSTTLLSFKSFLLAFHQTSHSFIMLTLASLLPVLLVGLRYAIVHFAFSISHICSPSRTVDPYPSLSDESASSLLRGTAFVPSFLTLRSLLRLVLAEWPP